MDNIKENEIYINKSHQAIKEIRLLRKTSKPDNLTIIEDLSILNLRYKYPFHVKSFFYCSDLVYKDDTRKTIDFYRSISESVYIISKKTYELITDKENRQGLIAIVYLEEKKFLDIKDKDFIIVSDSIEQAGNLGTIFRTCDASSVDAIIIVDARVNTNNAKVTASSRGMSLKVPFVESDFQNTLDFLLNNGFSIFLGEPILGKPYNELTYNGKIAIVIGSERYGINKRWYDYQHTKVFIPMYGEMNSLNVGVAASILIYEAKMKRQNINK